MKQYISVSLPFHCGLQPSIKCNAPVSNGSANLWFPCSPANGGRTCYGPSYEFQLCNTQECLKLFEDFREDQCKQWDPFFEYQNSKHHWLPYEHSDRKYRKQEPVAGDRPQKNPIVVVSKRDLDSIDQKTYWDPVTYWFPDDNDPLALYLYAVLPFYIV